MSIVVSLHLTVYTMLAEQKRLNCVPWLQSHVAAYLRTEEEVLINPAWCSKEANVWTQFRCINLPGKKDLDMSYTLCSFKMCCFPYYCCIPYAKAWGIYFTHLLMYCSMKQNWKLDQLTCVIKALTYTAKKTLFFWFSVGKSYGNYLEASSRQMGRCLNKNSDKA